MLLRHAGANYDELYIPGTHDMAELVSDAKEVFGPNFQPPTTIPQQIQLRKNRIHFTAAEDNLVLRGVVCLCISFISVCFVNPCHALLTQ
jgi:hypothetical protein